MIILATISESRDRRDTWHKLETNKKVTLLCRDSARHVVAVPTPEALQFYSKKLVKPEAREIKGQTRMFALAG